MHSKSIRFAALSASVVAFALASEAKAMIKRSSSIGDPTARTNTRYFRHVAGLLTLLGLSSLAASGAHAACPTPSPLVSPNGLAFDPNYKNLYLADSGANQVIQFTVTQTSAGVVTCLTPKNTITASLSAPTRLAFDNKGNLYVANLGSGYVTEYNSSLALIATIKTGLSRILGVAVDGNGNVYVANNGGNTIAVFQPAGNGNFNQASFSPITKDGSGAAIEAPGDLTYDAVEQLLLVALGPLNGSKILVWPTPVNAKVPTNIGTWSSASSGCPQAPNGPTGISVPQAGLIVGGYGYVSNYYNSRVIKFTAFQGSPPFCGSGASGGASQIAYPEGVAQDLPTAVTNAVGGGNVYVSNSSANTITVYGAGNIAGAPSYTYK